MIPQLQFIPPFIEDDWKQARLGHFTASRITDLKTAGELYKSGDKKGQKKPVNKYIYEVAYEIITGLPGSREVYSYNFDHGKMYEEVVLEKLGLEKCGFIEYNKYFGVTPDAVDYENDTIYEIKCPVDGAGVLERLLKFSEDDYYQIHAQFLATKASKGIRIIYDYNTDWIYKIPVEPNVAAMEEIKGWVTNAIIEVDLIIKELKEKGIKL